MVLLVMVVAIECEKFYMDLVYIKIIYNFKLKKWELGSVIKQCGEQYELVNRKLKSGVD